MHTVNKKPIAIALADLHIHNWRAYSNNYQRLDQILAELRHVISLARDLEVPILIPGDFFHLPKYLETTVMAKVFKTLSIARTMGVHFIAISGNHDMNRRNYLESPSNSLVSNLSMAFANFFCVDRRAYGYNKYGKGIVVSGVPYLHNNIGLDKTLKRIIKAKVEDNYNILLMHTDFPKAKTPLKHESKEVKGIDDTILKYLKQFDQVIMGHIHLKQELGKNIRMLGAFNQQTWGESGVECGYWIYYLDRKPKFVPTNLPKFIRWDKDEKPPEDGNFYAVSRKKEDILPDIRKGSFSLKLDKEQLARNYVKIKGEQNTEKVKALLNFIAKLDIK